jgi:hypothetical protein
MATVSVEDLANEILRHHSSPQILHLLDGLRSRNIDLREFCSRVRQLLGADVLIRTVNGLKQSRARAHPSMAAPSAPSAPAARFAPAAPSLRSSSPPPAASELVVLHEPDGLADGVQVTREQEPRLPRTCFPGAPDS